MRIGLAIAGLICAAGAVLQAADVAVLDSNNTRAYFKAHNYDYWKESNKYFEGWLSVLQTMPASLNIHVTVIKDENVNPRDLAKYKLLILSNMVSLSDDQQKTIQEWVIRGGRLLATYGSGYKDLDADPRQPDKLKLQEGGTTGLHQLWHDPMDKLFSSCYVSAPEENPADPQNCHTKVRITQSVDLTKGLSGTLDYGYHSNLLVQRPENYPGAVGFVELTYTPPGWHPTPAILLTRAAQGLVVYYAFAPEFSVTACLAAGDKGVSPSALISLMQNTVSYLLAN